MDINPPAGALQLMINVPVLAPAGRICGQAFSTIAISTGAVVYNPGATEASVCCKSKVSMVQIFFTVIERPDKSILISQSS